VLFLKVIKLGGSIFKEKNSFLKVPPLLEQDNLVIVVSAPYGVTDLLLNNQINKKLLENIYQKLASQMGFESEKLKERVYEILNEKDYEKIISHGERCNSLALKLFLEKEGFNVEEKLPEEIELNLTKNSEKIELKRSIKSYFKEKKIYIVPGFYAIHNGKIKTLGRGGSDYTATALANILDAENVTLYKDVSQLFTCDPKLVKNPFPITKISYEIAELLSYFGAKIIQYKAIAPAKSKNIPIIIKGLDKSGSTIIGNETNVGVLSISFLKDLLFINGKLKKIPKNVKYIDIFQNNANVIIEKEKFESIKDNFSTITIKENLSLILVGGDLDIGKKLLILNSLYFHKFNFWLLKDAKNFLILLVENKNLKNILNVIHNILFAREGVI
jgi:aspartate kinase